MVADSLERRGTALNEKSSISTSEWESTLRGILYPVPPVSEDQAMMLMSMLSDATKRRLLQKVREGKVGKVLPCLSGG